MPNSKIIYYTYILYGVYATFFNRVRRKHYVRKIYSRTVTNSSLAIRLVDRAGASVRFRVGCVWLWMTCHSERWGGDKTVDRSD